MKKAILIIVFGLMVSFNAEAANYVFKNYKKGGDIVTKKDPTGFKNLAFVKEKEMCWWDKRKEKVSEGKCSIFNAYIFKATYENSRSVTFQVHAEFKTKNKAEKQAIKFAKMVGQLPIFLKKGIKTLTIFKGNETWYAGNNNITIHTGSHKGKITEEVLLHESAHVSLDWKFEGSVNEAEWTAAQKLDNKFISKHAEEDFNEDIAETILWWIATRYRADRISKSDYDKVLNAVPNRLKYFDEQNYDMYPYVPTSSSSSEVFDPQPFECVQTDVIKWTAYAKSVDYNKYPSGYYAKVLDLEYHWDGTCTKTVEDPEQEVISKALKKCHVDNPENKKGCLLSKISYGQQILGSGTRTKDTWEEELRKYNANK